MYQNVCVGVAVINLCLLLNTASICLCSIYYLEWALYYIIYNLLFKVKFYTVHKSSTLRQFICMVIKSLFQHLHKSVYSQSLGCLEWPKGPTSNVIKSQNFSWMLYIGKFFNTQGLQHLCAVTLVPHLRSIFSQKRLNGKRNTVLSCILPVKYLQCGVFSDSPLYWGN